jgi:hypothetical protein
LCDHIVAARENSMVCRGWIRRETLAMETLASDSLASDSLLALHSAQG